MMEAKRYLQNVLDGSDVVFGISLVRKHPLPGGLYFDQDELVQNTRLLPAARRVTVRFDENYPGFDSCPLKRWIDL